MNVSKVLIIVWIYLILLMLILIFFKGANKGVIKLNEKDSK